MHDTVTTPPDLVAGPPTAKISEIAGHWVLSNDTTRKLLRGAGTVPVSMRPARYRWRDIWALEGVGYVPPADAAEFRRPLLTPSEVARFFPHLKPRTITDRALKGALPAIRLGTDWRFRECEIREAAIHG